MSSQPRVALVTGAARGLARGIAVDLAAAGYRVAFTYRPSGTPPDETKRSIAAVSGYDSLAVAADHERASETATAMRTVEDAYERIDVLVHAVGPLVTHAFARASLAEYRTALEGNLTSSVEAAFAVLPGMRARNFGRLVFFGMHGSQATLPARNLSLYAASKAAVVSFARSLALEEARHGITVNVIEPGDIRDKDIGLPGPRAVASAVRFLVSDDAAYVNGAVLAIDSGR